jgi:acetyltransferase-like isoleucine patch superfamily enzyme
MGLKLHIKNKLFEIKNKSKHIRIGYNTIIVNSKIGLYNTFYDNIEIVDCDIDDFVYISYGSKIANTKIGKFCSIGPDCKIGLGKHPTNFVSTFPAFFSTRKQCQVAFVNKNYFEEIQKIIIGNDVWIGANAIIMDGVNIEDGAIIAAGAIVTKDVQPYSIVAGIPAKEIRKRFSNEDVNKLLKIKWWERDLKWLKENADSFNDPDKFILKNY